MMIFDFPALWVLVVLWIILGVLLLYLFWPPKKDSSKTQSPPKPVKSTTYNPVGLSMVELENLTGLLHEYETNEVKLKKLLDQLKIEYDALATDRIRELEREISFLRQENDDLRVEIRDGVNMHGESIHGNLIRVQVNKHGQVSFKGL